MNDREPNAPAQTPQSPQQPASDNTTLRTARRSIGVGALLCLGGLLFTLVSYRTAEAGSRYVVATGAIFWGFVQALIGLCSIIGYYYRQGDSRRSLRIALAAIGAFAAVVVSTLFVLTAEEEDTVHLLDSEQEYRRPEIGLRVTIPAGYSAWEEEYFEETDSTYAHSRMYVLDGRWEFAVHTLQEAIADDVESIADIWEYCARCDSSYYDGGIITPIAYDTFGKQEILCSEGSREEYPDDIFSIYYLQHERTLITVYIIYPAEEYGLRTTRLRSLRLLGGIRFTTPEIAAESLLPQSDDETDPGSTDCSGCGEEDRTL